MEPPAEPTRRPVRDESYVEDQGEWERCASSRRMFLALRDAGKPLDHVATRLLELVQKFRPTSRRAREAIHYWKNGLRDEKDQAKELADRVYLVMVYSVLAFDEPVPPQVQGGGEAVVCMIVRREYPVAPNGFRKVGRMTGDPKSPVDFASLFEPVRIVTKKPMGRVYDSSLIP